MTKRSLVPSQPDDDGGGSGGGTSKKSNNSKENDDNEEAQELALEKQKMKSEYEDREYQSYLIKRATEGNVIICLPTGCGKTFIAVQLVKYYLPQSVRDEKKIIFVAPTVQLVHQQGNYLKQHISTSFTGKDSHVTVVVGDMKPEDWTGEKWKTILAQSQVFAMTVEVLRKAVEKAHVKWDTISLLILDECHNAQKNSSMSSLMEFYCNAKNEQTNVPRVLGLTATIIKGNARRETIREDISNMEARFAAKAITFKDYEQVLKCATSAKVEMLTYPASQSYEEEDGLMTIINDIKENLKRMDFHLVEENDCVDALNQETLKSPSQVFSKTKSPMKEFSDAIDGIGETLKELGPYCAFNAALKTAAKVYKIGYDEEQRGGSAEKAVILVANYLLTQLDVFILHVQNHMTMHSEPTCTNKHFILKFISPKLKLLIETLESTRSSPGTEQEPLCGLIFCQTRSTTQMISHYLRELSAICPDRFGFIRANFVIGSSSFNRNELVMRISTAKQQEVLNGFRKKELNLLVCTNVLEEGLNVPSCNFVLRFDPIVSFPSYVQSMGRARQKGARFYALVEESTAATQKQNLKKFENFGESLSECLRQNADHPDNYFNDESDEGISESKLNQLIPPFSPEGKASITALSAIETVYQYCHRLSCDMLSVLTPRAWWIKDEATSTYKAFVIMPPNAVVKKAESGYFSSKYVAKKAVFMEMCKKLYDANALHPLTLLPLPHSVPLHIDPSINELEKSDEEELKNGKKLGSKNRTSWYPKHIPEVFENVIKTPPKDRKEPLKLYAIVNRMKTYFGLTENEELLHFENRSYLFGILTHAQFDKVPDSLLLSRDGNFTLHLEEITLKSAISPDEIRILKDFQSCIFSDLLGMKHVVLKEMDDNPFYIAPLRTTVNGDLSTTEIAWELVPKLVAGRAVDYNKLLEIQERREMTFEADKYQDAVCIPSYSGDYHQRQSYCVLSVERERTPLSPFDDPTRFATYEEYFDKKYKIPIVHKDQPLILGKARPKQLNYLVTKYEEWKMNSKERQEARFCKKPISLIPELVRIHPLPASLFVQAKMLPSCLHRIFRLLIAEEIRESVATQFKWFETQEILKQLNGTLLENQNDEVTKLAKPLMATPTETAPKQGDSVMVKRPDPAPAPVSCAPEHLSRSNNINRIFGAKKKLFWCQIEYIHPRQIIPKEHIGVFRAGGYDDGSDAENDSEEESADISSSSDLEDRDPSAAEISQIQLIDSKDVPFQNFDAKKDFEESRGPLAWTIMEAITLANGNDAVSLEKLEMIGDSVLKFIATAHIFTHFPKWNEGSMTSTRMRLICNKHLYILGKRRNLGQFLAGSLYEPETSWLPPGQQVPSKFVETAVQNEINYSAFNPTRTKSGELVNIDIDSLSKEELCSLVEGRVERNEIQENLKQHTSYTHSRLGDKNIADCVEALIGAYYLHGGIDSALCLMKWMGLQGPVDRVTSPYKNLRDLPNPIPEYPKHQQDLISDVEIQDIESTLGYEFKNKWLIVEALTHPSCMKNTVTSAYERLEFLGDAVLDFLVTDFIYKTKKAETPGKLTDLRSALVNNVTFGSLAVRYGFHKVLMHFSSELEAAMDMFEQYQLSNGHKVTGHFTLLNDSDCLIAQDIDVPKALGDIFESLAGAVFLDSGMSLDTVWTVFYRLMKNEFDIFSENIPKAPVREIYEKFPGKVKFTTLNSNRSLETLGLKVVKLVIPGELTCKGAGKKKSNAKQAAAKFALKIVHAKEKNAKK